MAIPSASRSPTARSRTVLAVLAAVLLSAGCAQTPGPGPGLVDVLARPAERALMQGLRAYEDGQYTDAERHFETSLKAGPMNQRDRAAALKHLAFIYCTTDRIAACEDAFRAARRTDAAFALSRSEAGHPIWGPVYRKVVP